jgi:Zn-dependent protease
VIGALLAVGPPWLSDAILLYGVLLVSLVFHEASHGLFAMLGGDRTAYLGGQVTLNPVPHIRREPFGTVVLPVLLLLTSSGRWIIGYAHTPYDPLWAARHPRRAALMSAAGPLANLFLAGVAFAIALYLVAGYHAHPRPVLFDFLAPASENSALLATCRMVSVFFSLNLLLFTFNLIPIPPLDGAAVLEGVFPRQLSGPFALIRSQPFLTLIVIFVLFQELWFPYVLVPIWWQLYGLL